MIATIAITIGEIYNALPKKMHIHLRFYIRFQEVHEPLDICLGTVSYNILDEIKRHLIKWIMDQ